MWRSVWSSSFLSFLVWCEPEVNKCSLATTNTALSSWWGGWVYVFLVCLLSGRSSHYLCLPWPGKNSDSPNCQVLFENPMWTFCLQYFNDYLSWRKNIISVFVVIVDLGICEMIPRTFFFLSLLPPLSSPRQSAGDRLGLGAFIHLAGCSWNMSHQPWWFSMSGTNTLECQIMCETEELFYCSLWSQRCLVQYG